MPRGRLIFDGDNQYTEKKKRIHKLTSEVETKIDAIPWVVDDANSISTTDALSARMGKVLQDQINELKSMWRFLSTWDCVNWLPTTDPLDNPYDYRIWDYYIVSVVGTWTNYRPSWATYIHWQASTAVETETVKINDWYLYDGTHWILQSQEAVEIVIDSELSTSSTHAVENRVVTTALNTKQNTISDLETIRAGALAWSTAVQPWASLSVLDNTATGYQTAWDVANAIAWKADTSTVNSLAGRVTTVEGTVASQAEAIADLQQSEGWTSQDVADLKDDVADIKGDITDINTALAWKVDASSISTVATSGKASDLINDAGFITSSYIGNGQITVTQNWVNKWSFTLNQSWATNIALDAWLPSWWATGQVLVRTATWYAWANIETWWNVIALTQAQYDALPASTKADGKLRIISDAPSIEIWNLSIADNSPVHPKYLWIWTTAQYNALWTYSADTYYIKTDS